jgi:TRAP transporter TAXI family solute receptor
MASSETIKSWKYRFKYFGPGSLIVILSFAVAFHFIQPAPPRDLVMGTGGSDGAYFRYGNEFKKILAQNGIQLEVRTTGGTVENLHLLESGEIDIAFMQGGVGSKATVDGLTSLGSLYYEPIWVFYRSGVAINDHAELEGLSIGTSGEGSLTHSLSLKVLPMLGISPEKCSFVEVHGSEGADMLFKGGLDIAFMVYGYSAPAIQKLLESKNLSPLSLKKAEAIVRKNRYLSLVTLPQGIVSFAPDIPNRDIVMLATTAQLATRSDFHPALIGLFIDAAEEIFSPGGVFEETGEFPSLKMLDFKTSEDIRRYYKSGPSFLRRYLPFWLANFLDRMKIMLVPLVAVLFPFLNITPQLYRWRMRSKIFRLYQELELLDPELHYEEINTQLPEYLTRLDRLEQKVSNVKVPLGFRESVYNLRVHIDMIRKRLLQTQESELDSDSKCNHSELQRNE